MKKALLLWIVLATTCGAFADEWKKPTFSGVFLPLVTDETVYI